MNAFRNAKPHGRNRRVSKSVGTGQGSNTAQDTPGNAAALCLALVAVDAAREQLDRYALATDAPLSGVVDAADSLDAAHVSLVEAMIQGFSHASA